MTLSRLCAKCAKCPKVDTCDHKRMEMVGFLEPAAATSPISFHTNTEITIDLEDIKKEIEQSIAKQAGLYGDFFKSCT